ncbi:MAG: DEAD/DEAH box helicase [Rhodospirillales bacterium]|nr:DEAD/DEAH box helicase [Rhodospirillales bacterium]
MTTFADLKLIEPLLRAVQAENYETPTPIQALTIPHLLEGRDLFGCAQTGTGKTAAFALPILQRLAANKVAAGPRRMRCLVLAPTRELAGQINDSFRTYGRFLGLTQTVIFGGVSQNNQARAISRGLDIVVATPGRLLDLKNQGLVHLDRVEVLVLDEADRMLDMGFIHDIRKVLAAVPHRRQTLLYSATMPTEIAKLAESTLRDPVRVEVTPVATTAERIDQRVLFVNHENKRALLGEVLADPAIGRALVFTRTKHGANRVAEQLEKIRIRADAIHGNKSQNARQRALDDFRAGRIRVLVATDIAARGIDIDGITHVINYDLPNEPESYVHRIGRTARAGATGVAISFCDATERPYLRGIEKVIRQAVPVVEDHPYHCPEAARAANSNRSPARRPPPSRRGGWSRSASTR